MGATKPCDSPIASSKEFHETLVDAFSTAADAAVWMVQYILPNANGEVVERLKRVVPQIDRLTRAKVFLASFRKARVATKAADEAALFQAPDGEWYASYHDAALGLTAGLLDYLTLPHVNDAGEMDSRLVPSEVLYSLQEHAPRWRDRFDGVKSKYQAGMAGEATDIAGSQKTGYKVVPNLSVERQTFAARFRDVAERFKAQLAATAKGKIFEEANLLTTAGELFIEAADRGYLQSLPGTRELLANYHDTKAQYEHGELVGFIEGECVAYPTRPQALRVPCPQNLFIDVAGDDRIEVFNEGGTIKPTRGLPPKGLLPNAIRGMFRGSNFSMLLLNATGDEATDFLRLANAETTDRYGLACRLIADLLEREDSAADGAIESRCLMQIPSEPLVYTAGDHGWKLSKRRQDGSLADPSSEEFALARGLEVARASTWLRQKCENIDQYGGRSFFEADLPKLLEKADRLWHALVGLQQCLTDSAMRKRLGDAHAEAVRFAGEVAPSYVEAIYRAAERQYATINMLCRHGVLFNYLSRLHPTQAEKVSEPWPKLLKIEEIEFTGQISNDGHGNQFKSPVKLLVAICRQVKALPAIDPDHALAFLEKEIAAAGQANNCSGDGQSPNARQPSLEARALAVLTDHPDWTDKRIAEVLGCNRGSLYRLDKFKAARKLLKRDGIASRARGSKADGHIEAWEADQ